MKPKFQVSGKIERPIDEVFDAVYNPDKLSGYFATGGSSGPLDEGKTVYWKFADYPGEHPVEVREVVKNEKIVFDWPQDKEGGKSHVVMTFEALSDSSTKVSIAEDGWAEDEQGLKKSYQNCMGWTQMTCHMKAFLEFGINLREGKK